MQARVLEPLKLIGIRVRGPVRRCRIFAVLQNCRRARVFSKFKTTYVYIHVCECMCARER